MQGKINIQESSEWLENYFKDEPPSTMKFSVLGILEENAKLKQQIEEYKLGGCARDQSTTQFCAESAKLQSVNDNLKKELLETQIALGGTNSDWNDAIRDTARMMKVVDAAKVFEARWRDMTNTTDKQAIYICNSSRDVMFDALEQFEKQGGGDEIPKARRAALKCVKLCVDCAP